MSTPQTKYKMIPINVSDKGIYVARSKTLYTEDTVVDNPQLGCARDIIASIWQLAKLY